jgi:hypothetical protein
LAQAGEACDSSHAIVGVRTARIARQAAARPRWSSGRRTSASRPAPAQISSTICGIRPSSTPGTPSSELKAGASAHGAPVWAAW